MLEICKPFLNDSLKIIQDCHKIISIKRDHFQSLYNISRGYLEINGLLVPSSKVIHRFMYESYDLLVLESFIKLIKLLISDCDNQLSPLTFRLVYELGNRKIKVLFDPSISPKLKNLAVLTDSLADLYLTKNRDFISLYDDLRDILSILLSREQSVFLEMYTTIKAKKHYHPNEMLIKKARKISGEAFNKANQSVVSPFCIQRLSNFTALYASFSSLLHGNPYMVKNLVDEENKIYLI
jgi:hypothetical protein